MSKIIIRRKGVLGTIGALLGTYAILRIIGKKK